MNMAKMKEELLPKVLDTSTNPLMILKQAVESGTSVEVLERLMGLAERYEKNVARKAYDNAMADIRDDLPRIVKDRHVDFTTAHGRTNYKYEDLSSVCEALSPVMAQHGLSFRWRTSSLPNGNTLVTCIISHKDGHSEETSLEAKPDTTGNKNSIQAIGSAVTYLQRYTLKAALGIAAAYDDDAQSAGKKPPESPKPPVANPKDQLRSSLLSHCNGDVKGASQILQQLTDGKYSRVAEMNMSEIITAQQRFEQEYLAMIPDGDEPMPQEGGR
jgi:hypothetical protein